MAQQTRGRERGNLRSALLVSILLLAVAGAAQAASGSEQGATPEGSVAACSEVLYGAARRPAQSESSAGAITPPNPDGPTLVEAGIFVVDIDNVDVHRSAFRFEGYAQFLWCDSRLAFDPAEVGTNEKRFMGPAAAGLMDEIWVPDPTLVNRKGSLELSKRTISVEYDGTVRLEGLFTAELSANYDLRLFPFDRQVLPIELESFTWNADLLQFHEMKEKIGFADGFTVPEWHVTGFESRIEEVSAIQGRGDYSRLSLEIGVSRDYGFYLTKVALPLMVIVAMSWCVFWMVDEGFGPRTRVTTTGVLTIVAYQFAIARDIPKVAYLTLFDSVMVISFTLIATTVVESLIVSRVGERDPELAVRIDRASRIVFPLVYFLSIAAATLYYGIW